MTSTVPAHGQQQDYADPGAGAAAAPVFREVTADEYAAVQREQGRAAQTAAARAELAAEPPTQPELDPRFVAALMAEADDADRADGLTDDGGADGREYPDGCIAVPIAGRNGRDIVHVLPVDQWTSQAHAALSPPAVNYELWAADCLALDDHEVIWQDVRPTLGDVNDFFEEFRRLSGADTGKSGRSSGRSRRTGRR